MRRQPLVGETSERSWRAEELRRIRTNLNSVRIGANAQIMAITSAVPAEGKSITAANLAITFAKAGWRVVIVDANLRKPRIADMFLIENAVGLTDVVAGRASLDSALQPWGDHRLCVLPSGRRSENPSELLGSREMATVLQDLKDEFDIIIIDTPPLLPVTDAAVVAAQADGTVLVARHGRTRVGQVRTAVQALRGVGATLFGGVLNMTPTPKRSQLREYYRGSYRDERPSRQKAPTRVREPVPSPVRGSAVPQREIAVSGRIDRS
jgi:capsular exopolysaccharide synthesis family protein